MPFHLLRLEIEGQHETKTVTHCRVPGRGTWIIKHGFGLALGFIRSRLEPWQIKATWKSFCLALVACWGRLDPARPLCCELLSVCTPLICFTACHSTAVRAPVTPLPRSVLLSRTSFCSDLLCWQTNSRSFLPADPKVNTRYRRLLTSCPWKLIS
jgi:hypothetical protein